MVISLRWCVGVIIGAAPFAGGEGCGGGGGGNPSASAAASALCGEGGGAAAGVGGSLFWFELSVFVSFKPAAFFASTIFCLRF